jgi:hypothetical protein
VQLTKTELIARRKDVHDDGGFVDDCLFGRCGDAAQQASETVINRLGKTDAAIPASTTERGTMPGFTAAVISRHLQAQEGIAADRADPAARELADSWNEGDFDHQTTKDILGDYLLTNDDPRPKLIADTTAAAFGITLT